jgi:hypothetical protein
VLALLSNFWLGAAPFWETVPYGNGFGKNKTDITDHDRITAKAVSLIPSTAAVSATNTLGAHLSKRRRIFSFPVLAEAEWVAVDRTRPSHRDEAVAPEKFAAALARLQATGRFETMFDEDGILVLRRKS